MTKLFIIFLSFLAIHPVHVSMSSLSGDIEDSELLLTVRMYTDDLALDLYRLYEAEGIYSEIDHSFVFTGSDSYYNKYINDHLKIYLDEVELGTKLIEKEILDIETLLKFSVDFKDQEGKRLSVENKILTGLYNDQVNLFILKVDNTEKGVKFTARKTTETFSAE